MRKSFLELIKDFSPEKKKKIQKKVEKIRKEIENKKKNKTRKKKQTYTYE